MANKPAPKSFDPKKQKPLEGSPVVLLGLAEKGALAAGKIVSKIVQNAVKKHGGDVVKAGEQVAKDLGEHIKPTIIKAKPPEVTSAKVVKGTPSRTDSASGSVGITPSTKSIDYVKPGVSEAKAASSTKGLATKRQNILDVGQTSGTKASAGLVAKGADAATRTTGKLAAGISIPVVGAAAKVGYDAGKKSATKKGK